MPPYRGDHVSLAVYDLSPANTCLHPLGLGLYHTGVRIGRSEWTFSESGVFSHGHGETGVELKLRCVVPLGELSIDSKTVQGRISELKGQDNFGAGRYNLMQRNCNHFACALCETLGLGSIPAWVNRMAYFGSFLPQSLTADGGSSFEGGGSQTLLGNKSNNGRGSGGFSAFAGSGQTMGSLAGGDRAPTAVDRRAQMAAAAQARAMRASTSAESGSAVKKDA